MNPRPNICTREVIVSELEKAARLKPYSELYSETYKKYSSKFGNKV
jgi:hypothetical protein